MAELGLTLGRIARIVKGTLSGHGDIVVNDVTTDSRDKTDGGLFVALKGDRFDGHDFATQAAANGAAAVLVQKQIDGLMTPHILVGDTLAALQTLAKWRRREFKKKVVAITGSSGKTTTRRLLHAILSQTGDTHQPIRNFNNHIGVPLAVLGLESGHHAAVFEIGCSDFGETGPLTRIVDPDVGLITNVGPAHLKKLGSLDGVARAKGEMFLEMREDAVAVVNGDDARIVGMALKPGRKLVFGSKEDATVRFVGRRPAGVEGQKVILTVRGEPVEISTRFLGAHNAKNVTAATAAAVALDVEIEAMVKGLANVSPAPGRLAVTFGVRGLRIIDDTYNANPASMRAALETLVEMSGHGRSVAVLGDMLELGSASNDAHLQIGQLIASLGIDVLITIGERAALIRQGASGASETQLLTAPDHDAAAELVLDVATADDTVLVKGSRGMEMEKVVKRLAKGRE